MGTCIAAAESWRDSPGRMGSMAEDQAEGKRTGGKSRSCVRRRVSLAG